MFNRTYLACLQYIYPQYILILEHTGENRRFVTECESLYIQHVFF